MANSPVRDPLPMPTLLPLGDSGLLVRFGTSLTDAANRAAIALALSLDDEPIDGVAEVAPQLVSVLLRYAPLTANYAAIAGEVRLRLSMLEAQALPTRSWTLPVHFDGPDIDAAAAALGLSRAAFVVAHNARPLRVLATGFAPGFVYCGLHPAQLVLPRRTEVRPAVPSGSVLFAAGQTAIAATEMPTGWHLIGHTRFANFDPATNPPTQLSAGDSITFDALP